MNCIEQIQEAFASYLKASFDIDESTALTGLFILNVDENKQQFGDLNSNAPMIIAKKIGKNPREIALQIIAEFTHPLIELLEIADLDFSMQPSHYRQFNK